MSKVYIRFQTKKAQEPYRVTPPPPPPGIFCTSSKVFNINVHAKSQKAENLNQNWNALKQGLGYFCLDSDPKRLIKKLQTVVFAKS